MTGKTGVWPVRSAIRPDNVRWPAVIFSPGHALGCGPRNWRESNALNLLNSGCQTWFPWENKNFLASSRSCQGPPGAATARPCMLFACFLKRYSLKTTFRHWMYFRNVCCCGWQGWTWMETQLFQVLTLHVYVCKNPPHPPPHQIIVWFLLHNSLGAFCIWVEALCNDFSTKLMQKSDALVT